MRILGISGFTHDAACAVLEDGVVRAAIENDKIARVRNQGLPEAAIKACFETAKVQWDDIDLVALATRPLNTFVHKSLLRARLALTSPVVSGFYEAHEIGVLARRLGDYHGLQRQAGRQRKNVVAFDHVVCHAANAYFMSPFDQALIVVMEEDADGSSTVIAQGTGTEIKILEKKGFPDSLAWIYSLVTSVIGFKPHGEEHKTQWLSLEGKPIYKGMFLEMLGHSRTSLPRLNQKFFNRGLGGKYAFGEEFFHRIGVKDTREPIADDTRRALAASVQQACVEITARLIESYQRRLGNIPICLSGALFTNSLLVAALEERFGINHVFVPPAPGNPGSAVGAALWAWHRRLKKPRGAPPSSVFWGPRPTRQAIKDVLDNCKARYQQPITEQRKIDATVQLLENGKVVGWFQGAAEFGPRALGNRSVLASPWAPYVKENLNDFIKQREWFRPFGISVPEEDCSRFFVTSNLCRFMNSLAHVKPDSNPLPPDFCLPGGLVRLHVVERESNPVFWKLLKRFGQFAPAPLLLNTSFNLFGEPLVVSVRDALRSYFCSGLDALVLENFLLSKTTLPTTPATTVDNKSQIMMGA
jgi:carbamoyltransferase